MCDDYKSRSANRSVKKSEMINLCKDEPYYNLCDIKAERE